MSPWIISFSIYYLNVEAKSQRSLKCETGDIFLTCHHPPPISLCHLWHNYWMSLIFMSFIYLHSPLWAIPSMWPRFKLTSSFAIYVDLVRITTFVTFLLFWNVKCFPIFLFSQWILICFSLLLALRYHWHVISYKFARHYFYFKIKEASLFHCLRNSYFLLKFSTLLVLSFASSHLLVRKFCHAGDWTLVWYMQGMGSTLALHSGPYQIVSFKRLILR